MLMMLLVELNNNLLCYVNGKLLTDTFRSLPNMSKVLMRALEMKLRKHFDILVFRLLLTTGYLGQ